MFLSWGDKLRLCWNYAWPLILLWLYNCIRMYTFCVDNQIASHEGWCIASSPFALNLLEANSALEFYLLSCDKRWRMSLQLLNKLHTTIELIWARLVISKFRIGEEQELFVLVFGWWSAWNVRIGQHQKYPVWNWVAPTRTFFFPAVTQHSRYRSVPPPSLYNSNLEENVWVVLLAREPWKTQHGPTFLFVQQKPNFQPLM